MGPSRFLPIPATLAGTLVLGACSSAPPPVNVPAAAAPSPDTEVARLAGDLLSSDIRASEAAESALLRLDEPRRAALARLSERLPRERDPRWRVVLDENGLLPAISPEERLDLLLWKASSASSVLVVKAQDGLLDLARRDPERLYRRLERTGPGRDAIAVALGGAGDRRAVPALLALYGGPATPGERRAAAVALGRIAGDGVAPRPDADERERARDAERVLAWWRAGGATDARR